MSTVHFNIGKKIEINPFADVKYVKVSSLPLNSGIECLHTFLNKHSTEVSTRKINDTWYILYDVSLLDFTTLLKWYAPYRGSFLMQKKSPNTGYISNLSIQFIIEGDVMSCW